MAIFVDFVGLNTLIQEPVDINTNTVGTTEPGVVFSEGEVGQGYYNLRNTEIKSIPIGDYLAGLNIHRNGPYGYASFTQMRNGYNPVLRRGRLDNTFSHYEYPGQTLTFETGRNTRNYTYVRFTKLPTIGSSLAITFASDVKTIRFTDTGVLETAFGQNTANELNIKLNDSSLTSLRSDHDRMKLILKTIAEAVKKLELATLGHTYISTSHYLYGQGIIYLSSKGLGPNALNITSAYTHIEKPSVCVVTYSTRTVDSETICMTAGDRLVLKHPDKGEFVINFTDTGDQDDVQYSSKQTANINRSVTKTANDTATAVAAIINTLPDYSATVNSAEVKIESRRSDARFKIAISEIDAGSTQAIGYIEDGADNVAIAKVSNHTGTLETISRVVPQRRGPLKHYSEVPVVSRHKPLKLVGSVTEMDPNTGLDGFEEVEVFTTLGNKTTYFSNAEINKFFDFEEILDHDYEDFVDLYLEGGLDGDTSPIDEFQKVQYRQVVYPKEKYTYKHHTRNRPNFVSRYWRDIRVNRTKNSSSYASILSNMTQEGFASHPDNGFGFRVFSQSAWVLDGEENFKDLTFLIRPGRFTLGHPKFYFNSALTTSGSGHSQTTGSDVALGFDDLNPRLATSFTFPISNTDGTAQRSLLFVDVNDLKLPANAGLTEAQPLIHGLAGWPYAVAGCPIRKHALNANKTLLFTNPYDTTASKLFNLTAPDRGTGLHQELDNQGYKLTQEFNRNNARAFYFTDANSRGWRWPTTGSVTDSHGNAMTWKSKTTSSCFSTWISPASTGPRYATWGEGSHFKYSQPTGSIYHEWVSSTGLDTRIGSGTGRNRIAKAINFTASYNYALGLGGIQTRLGTSWRTEDYPTGVEQDVHMDARDPGAVCYKTNNLFGVDNPIYKAAMSYNNYGSPSIPSPATIVNDITARKSAHIAMNSVNHLFIETDLKGESSAANWRAANTGTPKDYVKVWVNASQSNMPTRIDPYNFLTISDSTRQLQTYNGNSSIKLSSGGAVDSQRSSYALYNNSYDSLNPFTSTGFSFSYWIKFDSDVSDLLEDENAIFTIQNAVYAGTSDHALKPIIDHTIGGANGKQLKVGFTGFDGTTTFSKKYKHTLNDELLANTWYNISFSIMTGSGTDMEPRFQVYKKGQSTPQGASNTWNVSGYTNAALTETQWSSLSSSARIYVLPAGNHHILTNRSTQGDTELKGVSLDGLRIWNGGLTEFQMNELVSGSAANDEGAAGNLPTPKVYTDYPATDQSTALQVKTTSPAALRHARRHYELNTYRHPLTSDANGRTVGRITYNRAERVYPFGSSYKNHEFRTDVISAGTSGSFDFATWFRCSHDMWRTRSLRYRDNMYWSGDSDYNFFNTNMTKRDSTSSRGDGSNRMRGFFVSFWYKPNGANHATNSTCILRGTDGAFAIERSANNFGSNSNKLRFFVQSHGSTNAAGYTPTWNFFSNEELVQDKWHFCSVLWNGKTGPEMAVSIQIDGNAERVMYSPPTVYTAGPDNLQDDPVLNYHTSTNSYKDSVYVLTSGNNSSTRDGQIAYLTVIKNPQDPTTMAPVRSALYNNGQPRDSILESAVTTALAATAINNGGPGRAVDSKDPTNTAVQTGGYGKQTGFGEGAVTRQIMMAPTSEKQLRLVWENASGYPVAPENKGISFSFTFKARTGTLTQWKAAKQFAFVSLGTGGTSTHSNAFIMFKGRDNTSDVNFRYQTSTSNTGWADWKVTGLMDHLCDGDTHDVFVCYAGETNSAGRPINFKVFVDGVDRAAQNTVDSYYPYHYRSATNKDHSDIMTIKKITFGGSHSNSTSYIGLGRQGGAYDFMSMPYNYFVYALRVYNQYMGGDNQANFRNSLRYAANNNDNIKDAMWYLPTFTNQTVSKVNVAGGAANLTNIEFEPPMFECLISPTNGDDARTYSGGSWTYNGLRNTRTKTPTIEHHFRLGAENECTDFVVGDSINGLVLNCTGAAGDAGVPLSSSNHTELAPGSPHWKIDWWTGGYGSNNGDVNQNGTELTPSNATCGMQSLLHIGHLRQPYTTQPNSIEINLSNSGGAYGLQCYLPREGNDTNEISAPNIIVPGRWYYLYAKFNNMKVGQNASYQLYLNGEEVSMTQRGSTAGTKYSGIPTLNAYYNRPAVGGGGYQYQAAFAGYLSDICFWSDNDTTRKDKYRNKVDGIRNGSRYIDTSDDKIVKVIKTGFLEGDGTTRVTEVSTAGTDIGSVGYGGMSSTSRAFITGPPIEFWEDSSNGQNGATVISFWAKLPSDNTSNEQTVLSFNTDHRFPEELDLQGNPAGAAFLTNNVNPTDTSATPNNNTYATATLTLKRRSNGGYSTQWRQMRGYDQVRQYRNRNRNLNYGHSTATSNTNYGDNLVHFTIVHSKARTYTFMNGVRIHETSWNWGTADQTLNRQGIRSTQNGWNNIGILGEQNKMLQNGVIDELAILYYTNAELDLYSNDSNAQSIATDLYNGGAVYDFGLRKGNLYAWWRMGENRITSDSISHGTTLGSNREISDESGSDHDAHVLFSGRLKAIKRVGAGGYDLKNAWLFNSFDTDDNKLPRGGFVSTVHGLDSIGPNLPAGARNLEPAYYTGGDAASDAAALAKWGGDFTYDSYKLVPVGWLANEGTPVSAYIAGYNNTNGSILKRPCYNNHTGRPVHFSDQAIFSGVPTAQDKTAANTVIKVNSVPANGFLTIVKNPHSVGGLQASRVYTIEFKNVTYDAADATTHTDTAFTQPSSQATISFSGAPTADQTILIISTDGTQITYTAKAATNTGANQFANTDAATAATALKSCIEHASGHNGKITVANPSSGVLILTQATQTPAGDTTITSNLSNASVPAKFSGGTKEFTNYAMINTSQGANGAGDSAAEVAAAIKVLLDTAGCLNAGSDYTSAIATDKLTYTSTTFGDDGAKQVVGSYYTEGSVSSTAVRGASTHGEGADVATQEAITITSVIGYSHITKALTRAPSFGWVDQGDSDFSRQPNVTGVSDGTLVVHDGDTTVKPWLHYRETNREPRYGEDYRFANHGKAGATLNMTAPYRPKTTSKFEGYGDDLYGLWDSGSAAYMVIENKPSLDFNYITLGAGALNVSSSMHYFSTPGAPKPLVGGATGARAKYGPGLLQNNYNQFTQLIVKGNANAIDPQLTASACYFRRHSLTASTSFVAPYSGFLAKLSASHNLNSISTSLLGNMSASHLYLGSAKWEAGDFAGYFDDAGTFVPKPKKPFFDTYADFVADARPLMKDYGIVPEFKMSEHVARYLARGATEQKLDFLNITGGLESADVSNKKDFYEVYSTTDFLKHFEVVQEDHSDFVDPFSIKLRCSVVKKFLPYEGFYPAQRTAQVAQQFYSSYADNINISGNYDLSGVNGTNNYAFQYLLNPLFSPGIMFNTIKSGVAVDYPLVTDQQKLDSIGKADNGGAQITQQFDTRVPFEALIEPEKFLANVRLGSNEVDEQAETEISVEWGGQGDGLYNLMISNFLAETSEFFLQNKSFTTISSLSQGDANFGNAQAGNVYMMRLKMFRTTKGTKTVAKNYLSRSFGVPQDTGSMSEAFTMYSRPSAFGPPQFLSSSATAGFTALTWASYKFDGTSGSMYIDTDDNPFRNLKPLPFQHDFSYVTGATYGLGAGAGAVGNEAYKGYNYPFTPPYYHGEAWADITFIPTETKKYSLQEIINQSSVEFYRYFAASGSLQFDGVTPRPVTTLQNPLSADENNIVAPSPSGLRGQNGSANLDPNNTGQADVAASARLPLLSPPQTLSHVHDRTVVINDQAMQLASSVNLFSQGVLEQDITTQTAEGIGQTTNVQVDTDIANKYRWIIQTKFETPMLNFNHYTYGKHTNDSARDNYVAQKLGSTIPPNVYDASKTLPLYTDNTYGIELPGVGPMQTPIGMWHQYGHIPQSTKEGVFLQVDDVPNEWVLNAMLKPKPIAKRYLSLASLCGFSTDPVRLGEIAGDKEISEAVVAIPFFEQDGRRRFFNMRRAQIDFALDPARRNLVGQTVIDMVDKMKKFVFPPALDFVSNRSIDPFSMYIFEFRHTLTKQDLADIWQNLPPTATDTVETEEAAISHELLSYELLGQGGRYKKGVDSEIELVRNDRAESINPEIQWMVFKVKQRAANSYFEKIFARNESQQLLSERLKLGVTADALGRKSRVSYNWPYDFFSMIEGIKLTAEIDFMEVDEEESKVQEKPVPKPRTKASAQEKEERATIALDALKAVSGLASPSELASLKEKQTEEAAKKKKRAGKIRRRRRIRRRRARQIALGRSTDTNDSVKNDTEK